MSRAKNSGEPHWLGRFGAGWATLLGGYLRRWLTPAQPPAPTRPTVEVLAVAPAALDAEKLLDYAVDEPRPGQHSQQYSLDLRGWVVGKRAPVSQVEVFAGTRLVRRADVWLPRADLAARFAGVPHAGACGFHACVSTVGLHSEFQLRIEAVFADGTRAPLGTIAGRHEPVHTSYSPRRQPILLTALARTGTTWMIRLLAEHPEIVVHPRYPFESCPALYLLHALQVFTTPSNPVRPAVYVPMRQSSESVYPLPLFCRDEEPVLHAWLRREYVEHHADCTLQTIDRLYDTIAAMCRRPHAAYFCEKTLGQRHLPAVLSEIYPEGKEIFLVRDFRDMVCSRQSFFGARAEFRDHAAFGQVIAEAVEGTQSLLEHWTARGRKAHLVHYEDLITRPIETLQGIFRYLEIDCRRDAVQRLYDSAAANSGIRAEHRTVENPLETIGRWRHDLDATQQARCIEACGQALRAFGYEKAA